MGGASIQAVFAVSSLGTPTVATLPPYERAGFYLMTISGGRDLVFTELLPALEDVAAGGLPYRPRRSWFTWRHQRAGSF